MPRPPGPAGRRSPVPAAVLGGVTTGALLLPEWFGLARRSPFVAAVAFRPHTAVVLAAAAAVVGTARRGARQGTVGLGSLALGAVAAIGCGAVVAARAGQRPSTGPAAPDRGARTGPSTTLRILTFNVWHGQADRGALSILVERAAPDLVVLPEAGAAFRDALLPSLRTLGYRAWVSTRPGVVDGLSVALLAAPRVGALRVRAGTEMEIAHLEATGGLLGARTLYAAHTVAPVGRRRVALWRRDLRVLRRWCTGDPAPIVVGDLNATLDHAALRAALGGCRSAAGRGWRALAGTYPTRLPRWLGIQIDHILIPADALTSTFTVIEVAGSDHRAVLADVLLHTGTVACNGQPGGN